LLCNARGVDPGLTSDQNVFELPLEEYAFTYSTGMKKKLALTAVLLQENDFFILDEPFNGVDIQSNMIIAEIIHKLKSLGKIVVISSHIFSTLSENCDMIYLLREGELIRGVNRDGFDQLEVEMKMHTIGNKINRLRIK
jgi:ABC-2 type transport system ATP-binding protein